MQVCEQSSGAGLGIKHNRILLLALWPFQVKSQPSPIPFWTDTTWIKLKSLGAQANFVAVCTGTHKIAFLPCYLPSYLPWWIALIGSNRLVMVSQYFSMSCLVPLILPCHVSIWALRWMSCLHTAVTFNKWFCQVVLYSFWWRMVKFVVSCVHKTH